METLLQPARRSVAGPSERGPSKRRPSESGPSESGPSAAEQRLRGNRSNEQI